MNSIFSSDLLRALSQKHTTGIYTELDKLTEPLSGYHAARCCSEALHCKLSIFAAVLDHCEPLERFCYDTFSFMHSRMPPVAEAAWAGRPRHLQLLLDRGLNPNVGGEEGSPLELAINTGSPACVEVLLAHPDLDTTLTAGILLGWSHLENGNANLDKCLRLLAPRFLGQTPAPDEPTPIPPQLDFGTVLCRNNPRLAARICRERRVPTGNILSALARSELEQDRLPDLVELLDAMFTVHPALLRREWPRSLLIACALANDDGIPERLEPWLEQLPGREIVLIPHSALDWVPTAADYSLLNAPKYVPRAGGCLLERWETRLGDRFRPVLDRRKHIFIPVPRAETCRFLLSRCAVRYPPVPGKLSPLARSVLLAADPKLLDEQLQPGGALYGEDPRALLECLNTNFQSSYAKKLRAVLAGHLTVANDYAL